MSDAGDAFDAALRSAPGARRVRFPAGTVMFRPADACEAFVAVTRGAIRVSLTGASGREIVLYRVRPGDVCLQTFACLVEGRRYGAEGVAETAIEGVAIPAAAFDRLLGENEAFRRAVCSAVARRFADLGHAIELLAFTGLAERLAGALLRLAGAADAVEATHDALAAEIGSAREVVGRQLAAFARAGLVAVERGRVRLLDRGALSHLAESAPPV